MFLPCKREKKHEQLNSTIVCLQPLRCKYELFYWFQRKFEYNRQTNYVNKNFNGAST